MRIVILMYLLRAIFLVFGANGSISPPPAYTYQKVERESFLYFVCVSETSIVYKLNYS